MAKFKSVVSNFKKIKEAMTEEKTKGASSYENSAIFKPAMVSGQSETEFRIRFLPMDESSTGKPWMMINYHMFERPGDKKFVKAIDPRTFDPKASNPISDYASNLWKSDNVLDKEQAKKYFKKARYFTFVYIKEAPENQKDLVGKVLIYEVGQKIYEILENSIRKYDKCFWDPYKGQDFLLVIKKRGEWPDYSSSNWIGDSCPIVEDEKQLDEVCDKLSKLSIQKMVIEKDGVKSGAELKELLEGGMKEVSTKNNVAPTRDLVEEVSKVESKSSKEPVFGNEDTSPVQQKPAVKKEEPKAAVSAASSDEVSVDLSELDLNFTDDDFKP